MNYKNKLTRKVFMNTKSKLVILGATLAVVGAFSYQASANMDKTDFNYHKGTMLNSAVEQGIITLEQKTQLQGSCNNENKESMRRNYEEKLNQALEKGIINQDEADKIRSWHENKPGKMQKNNQAKMMRKNMTLDQRSSNLSQ
jgi:hypothetical protein